MTEAMKAMPRLDEVLEELRQREPIFHRAEFGTTREDFERITDEAFWEIGASGQRYSRDHVLDVLEARHRHPARETWEARDFECHPLAPSLYLLSYVLQQEDRLSRRSTVWRRTVDGWKIVFHQGTLILRG